MCNTTDCVSPGHFGRWTVGHKVKHSKPCARFQSVVSRRRLSAYMEQVEHCLTDWDTPDIRDTHTHIRCIMWKHRNIFHRGVRLFCSILCLNKNAPLWQAVYSFDKHRVILINFGEQHHHTSKNDVPIQFSMSFTFAYFAFKQQQQKCFPVQCWSTVICMREGERTSLWTSGKLNKLFSEPSVTLHNRLF